MIGSVEELRRYLNTGGGGGTSTADDELLADLLAAASSRASELAADRTLEPTPASDTDDPVTYTFTLTGHTCQVPDLREVVSITLDGVAYAGDYSLRGRRGQPAWRIVFPWGDYSGDIMVPIGNTWAERPARALTRELAITGRWGPDPEVGVAPHVKEAVLVWAARVYQERAARWSDSRSDPDSGIGSYFRAVPASVKATIDSLKVPGL